MKWYNNKEYKPDDDDDGDSDVCSVDVVYVEGAMSRLRQPTAGSQNSSAEQLHVK
jgi:hypothetical protein